MRAKTKIFQRTDLIGCEYFQCGNCNVFFYFMVAGKDYKSPKSAPKFCPNCGREGIIVDFRLNFYDLVRNPEPMKQIVPTLPNRKAKRRRS